MNMKKKKQTKKIIYILKTLGLLWKANPIKIMLIFILELLIGFVVPLQIYLWKMIIDEIAEILNSKLDFQYLTACFLFYLLISVVSLSFSNIANYLQNIYSTELNIYIDNMILNKIKKIELSKFDYSETYNIIKKSQDETLQRSISTLEMLVELVKNFASLFGIIGLLITFNPLISFLTILSTIPIFYLSCKVMNKWFNVFNERFEGNRFIQNLKEIVIQNNNIKEIKIFNAFDFIQGKINEILQKNLKEDKAIRKKFLLENISVSSLDEIVIYLIKGLVILISLRQKLSIGSITMYISSVDNTKACVSSILSLLSDAYENGLYLQNIFLLLNISEEENGNIENIDEIRTIEFRDVSFKYPESNYFVLNHINIIFERNTTYAIVGLNGAGKTTLIKLLLGLYSPTSGDIFINEINIINYKKSALYQKFSVVFQDYIKYPFDIRTNIGIGNIDKMFNNDLIKEAAVMSGASTFIDDLPERYNTQLQKGWAESTEISIGQWQKIAIARALMREALVTVLDEPTASLDAMAEYDIIRQYEKMKNGNICVLITHRLNSIKLADKIILLEKGEIKEEGSHIELIKKKGIYFQLYQIQAGGYYDKDLEF